MQVSRSGCYAWRRREPSLLHHSDQSSQYASTDYQQLLTNYQVQTSMSRQGNCYNNTPVENFFVTLKAKWVHCVVYVLANLIEQSLPGTKAADVYMNCSLKTILLLQ